MGGGMTPVNASLFPLPPNPLPALMDDSLREEKAEEWSDAVDQTPSYPSLSPPPVDEADAGGNHNPTFTGRSHPNLPPPPPEPPAEVVLVEGDNYDHLNQEDEEDEDNGHPLETPASPSPETLKPPAAIHPPSDDDDDDDEAFAPAPKKQKPLAAFTSPSPPSPVDLPTSAAPAVAGKKPKKKNNNVWTKSTSRKGKKKTKNAPQVTPEDTVLITPIPRFPDKSDDSPESQICLSRVYKAEKVELSEDRLSAGSTKGYRMVRATRGVVEGAWYFEIRVVRLGETGHSRLGWTTEKGDLQAPVGYDGNSFGYRDIDGTKVHKALRERYGNEGFFEGDVIGFYISLPEGELYAPKPPHLVWFKGQRYMYSADGKDEPPKVVPGSEISFFKNGVCQGVAFTGLFGGRYYPAASMYTLPNQPNCEVRFNFGPDFEFFPQNFGDRPIPRPLIEVPYHGYDGRESRVEVPAENGLSEKAN